MSKLIWGILCRTSVAWHIWGERCGPRKIRPLPSRSSFYTKWLRDDRLGSENVLSPNRGFVHAIITCWLVSPISASLCNIPTTERGNEGSHTLPFVSPPKITFQREDTFANSKTHTHSLVSRHTQHSKQQASWTPLTIRTLPCPKWTQPQRLHHFWNLPRPQNHANSWKEKTGAERFIFLNASIRTEGHVRSLFLSRWVI